MPRPGGGVEAAPVVLDPQGHGRRGAAERHGELPRLGVAYHVGQRFLGHPVNPLLPFRRQRRERVGHLPVERQVRASGGGFGQLAQGEFEAEIVERAGAQGDQGVAGLAQTAAHQGFGFGQQRLGLGGIAAPVEVNSGQLDAQAAERVGQRIVQFAGQAVALAADGQALQRAGLGAQALIGRVEHGLLGAQAGHDGGDQIADEQQAPGEAQAHHQLVAYQGRRGARAEGAEAEQAQVERRESQAVEHHARPGIEPGEDDHPEDEDREDAHQQTRRSQDRAERMAGVEGGGDQREGTDQGAADEQGQGERQAGARAQRRGREDCRDQEGGPQVERMIRQGQGRPGENPPVKDDQQAIIGQHEQGDQPQERARRWAGDSGGSHGRTYRAQNRAGGHERANLKHAVRADHQHWDNGDGIRPEGVRVIIAHRGRDHTRHLSRT